MQFEDNIYYLSHGFAILLIGIFIILLSLKKIDGLESVFLWFFCIGIILLSVGIIKTKKTADASPMHLLSGFFLITVSFITIAKLLRKITTPIMIGYYIIIFGVIMLLYVLIKRDGR